MYRNHKQTEYHQGTETHHWTDNHQGTENKQWTEIAKTKTLQPMTQLEIPNQQDVASGTTYDNRGIYGTNCTDLDISLMKADVFKVRGVYMSADFATPAVAPTMSYTTSAGSNAIVTGDIFQPGDKITGSNGAIARIINGSASGSGGVGG